MEKKLEPGDRIIVRNHAIWSDRIAFLEKFKSNLWLVTFELFPIQAWLPISMVEKISEDMITNNETTIVFNQFSSDNCFGWGGGTQYQLGNDKPQDVYSPISLTNLNGFQIKTIAMGTYHTVLLTSNGLLFAFGANDFGQCGLGESQLEKNIQTPKQIEFVCPSPTEAAKISAPMFVELAAGANHNLAVTDTGDVYCWGSNEKGQLGIGEDRSQAVPVAISFFRKENVSIEKIACGEWHSAAISTIRKVWAWGRGSEGQIGDKTRDIQVFPVNLKTLVNEQFVSIVCGRYHTAALTDKGEVFSWGSQDEGALGRGGDPSTPKKIDAFKKTKIIQIASGHSHLAFVSDQNELFTTGSSVFGQLGYPCLQQERPKAVSQLKNEKVTYVACGSHHTVVVCEGGKVYSFGTALNGRLGVGVIDKVKQSTSPILVSNIQNMGISKVFSGGSHNIALRIAKQRSYMVEKFFNLFNSTQFSDITFVIQQNKIHAHKIVLAAYSDYFLKFFNQEKSNEIVIENVTFEGFSAMIKCLYCGLEELRSLQEPLLREVRDLAVQYHIKVLELECKYITETLTTEEFKQKNDLVDFNFAFNNPDSFSDLTFNVNGKKIYGHKVLLSTGIDSDYWKAMFTSGMKESSNEVTIEDINIESLSALLHTYYLDPSKLEHHLTDQSEFLLEILVHSERFLMGNLKKLIEQQFSAFIDLENVLELLTVAFDMQFTILKQICMDFLFQLPEEQAIGIFLVHLSKPLIDELIQEERERMKKFVPLDPYRETSLIT